MTAKKRWLNKICHDSQDFPKNTQVDISWSSSESDEETLLKKKKVDSASKKWIASNLAQNRNNILPKVETNIYHSSSNCYQFVPTNDCDLNNSSSEVIRILDASCDKANESNINTSLHQYCESPVISYIKLEELSPVLVQTSECFNISKDTSPVLGNKRQMLRKIRSRYKTIQPGKQIKQTSESSPDLFDTQSTQIIDADSPEGGRELSLSISIMPTERIDPFPSQHSSQVINSDTSSSSSAKDNILFYHQPAPKKKRYKKGGLASLLQKTLHLQRTRVSIWQHELYTKKSDNIISFEEGEIVNFIVKNKWKEYGSTLLECTSSHLSLSSNNLGSCNTENVNFFIIIIGFSANLNVIFNVNGWYDLFPPYSVKRINYKSLEVPCYFNITKLVVSKQDL